MVMNFIQETNHFVNPLPKLRSPILVTRVNVVICVTKLLSVRVISPANNPNPNKAGAQECSQELRQAPHFRLPSRTVRTIPMKLTDSAGRTILYYSVCFKETIYETILKGKKRKKEIV
jgi:hypothetical protein